MAGDLGAGFPAAAGVVGFASVAEAAGASTFALAGSAGFVGYSTFFAAYSV